MWSLVTGLISEVIGGVRDRSKAKHERKMAVEKRKTDLAKGEQSHNHTWELAALQDEDGGAWLARWFFIVFYTLPVIYTCFDPNEGEAIWKALEEVPSWVIGVVVTMTGWAFAAKPLQNAGAGLVGTVIKVRSKKDSSESKES